jgi:hypothetical protein
MSLLRYKQKLLPYGNAMGGGSSGGGGGPTQTTTYSTNIPEYARPYVENMLQSTQAQIYNADMTGFRPYQPYSTDVNNYFAGFSPLQQQAQQSAYYLQAPSQFQAGSELAGAAGVGGLGAAEQAGILGQQALGYGAAGAEYGGMGAQQALQTARQTGRQAGMYGRMGAGYGARGVEAAEQGFGAGEAFARQATDPYATAAYMSPYMQNVVDYQKSQALRDYGIGQGLRKAQAVGAGAFGGSRQAIAEAEAERALGSQLQGIAATGSQKAFEDAQRQQQFGAQLGLQGLQAGYGGLGLGMQGAGLGLQGVGAQQAAGQLGLAGTAQGIQGAGMGLQGIGQAVGAGQFGLGGLGAATQAAGTLGQLGGAQLGAQRDIIGLQSQMGAQQQAAEQAKINQAIQDYAIAQQYPFMQLGMMNAMLRGLPLQTQTTQLYQAQPSTMQQGIGLLGAGASLFGRKEGGVIKEYREGGITKGYKPGGVVDSTRADLEEIADMPGGMQRLEQIKNSSPSTEVRKMAAEVIMAKQMEAKAAQQTQQARMSGIAMAGGPAFESQTLAGGGIIAFGDPELNPNEDQVVKDEDKVLSFEEKLRRSAAAPKAPFQYDSLASKLGQFPSKLGQFQPAKKYTPEQLDEIARGQGVFAEGSPALPGMPPEEIKPAAKTEEKQTGTKAAQAAESKAAAQGPNSFAKFLSEIKGAGPKGQIGAEYEKFLDERLGKSAERLSRDERMAMAKGFLKFASTPAPGGIGQAAAAGLTEYATGVEAARKTQDTMEAEAQKARMELDKARRAEQRGDVAAAQEAYGKYEDRMSRIQAAQISAGAAGQAGRFEKEAVERVMAENPGMKFADALQIVKGAGRFESTEVQKAKVALASIDERLGLMGKKDPRRAELEAQRAEIIRLLTPGGGVGGGQGGGGQGPGILRFDAQGNPIRG